jgi:hypothetical protein
VRHAFAGQGGEGGGLARAVAPDQPDPVPGLHPQVGVADEDAGAGAQLETGRRYH